MGARAAKLQAAAGARALRAGRELAANAARLANDCELVVELPAPREARDGARRRPTGTPAPEQWHR